MRQRPLFLVGLLSLFVVACAELPCRPASFYAAPAGAPYRAEEVAVPVPAGYTLAGTLTVPDGTTDPLPAVVLISGSRPQARDMTATTAEPYARYRPFRQLADSLSRRGLAVLRLDDRGTACSGGGPVAQVSTAGRADDTRAALAWLRGRQDIAPDRLALVGISEGASIAVMIAAKDHDLGGVVSMAGNAGPGWQTWAFQTRYLISLGQEMSPAQKARWQAGEDPEAILAERVAEARAHVAAGEANAWWTYFFDHDPLTDAARVASPVLFLHGDRDSNVPAASAEALAAAARDNGNADVTVTIFEGYNHLFLPDADGGFRRYGELLATTNQVPDEVLDHIADWLADRLDAGRE